MSVQAIVAVLHESETTQGTRLVLIALANYYGEDGAWPSIDRLASDCRLSPRQVQRCLKTAVDAGELWIEPNAGQNGTNRYVLLLPGVTKRHPDISGREMSPKPKEPKAVEQRLKDGAPNGVVDTNPNQPSDRQMFFGEKLGLDVPAIVKLNKRHGREYVLSAMEQLHGFPPADPVANVYAYVDSVASFKAVGA